MMPLETGIQNEYFISLIILVVSIIVARILLFFLKGYLHKFAEKSKTDIDDIILRIITKPFFILVISIGLYFSLKSLSTIIAYTRWFEDTFFVFWVLLSTLIISRILSALIIRNFQSHKRSKKPPQLIDKIIVIVVYLIAFLIILGHFKIEISLLVTTLGIGGLVIGLALQTTLSNFFAGLHIISDRPIKVGDFVELLDGNISGYVEDIGWRSTRIRTLLNQIVIIPNSKLAGSIIINDSLPDQEIVVLIPVGVAHGSNLKKVEEVTIDVATKIQKTVPGAVKDFEPFLRYHTLGHLNIGFTVTLLVEKVGDKPLVIHEFIKALKERYDKEGIEIS
ncbi:MAG: mechanosensitive ion channel family protein [Candidatus Paceibacterota bacterium]